MLFEDHTPPPVPGRGYEVTFSPGSWTIRM